MTIHYFYKSSRLNYIWAQKLQSFRLKDNIFGCFLTSLCKEMEFYILCYEYAWEEVFDRGDDCLPQKIMTRPWKSPLSQVIVCIHLVLLTPITYMVAWVLRCSHTDIWQAVLIFNCQFECVLQISIIQFFSVKMNILDFHSWVLPRGDNVTYSSHV